MKIYIGIAVALVLIAAVFFVVSGNKSASQAVAYKKITPSEAKELMGSNSGAVILDVRTEAEFAEGHIPGAILLPDYDIAGKAEETLTDKDALILVYCRSGRRSAEAAKSLLNMGYTNVQDFGGIIDWPYEVEK